MHGFCQLQEVIVGSLTERKPCGEALTKVHQAQHLLLPAMVINEGQVCAGGRSAYIYLA